MITSGPSPCSAICMRMPFASIFRCFSSDIGCSAFPESLRVSHFCLDASHEIRITQFTSWLDEIANAEVQFVDIGVRGRKPQKSRSKAKRVFQVSRPLPAGPRINEVGSRRQR